jgi:stage II sporulation protein D
MPRRSRRPWIRIAAPLGIAGVAFLAACARGAAPPAAPAPNAVRARVVRVSLGIMPTVTVSAADGWTVSERDGRVVAQGAPSDRVDLAASGASITVTDGTGATHVVAPPLALSARRSDATLTVNGRRYRGELSVVLADSGLRLVNQLDVEAYLRGVVPRELGIRGASDRAALEAQAVAARSYAVTRLGNPSRAFDVTATTTDQVYGGVDAENALADAAVAATEGLVLMYDGRVVSAPYHSTCGGSTAAPDEIWQSRNEPYLHRVSDQIPGSDRFYCDIAPRFRWERSWRSDSLATIVDRYVRAYASVPAGPLGSIRSVAVDGRTPSGRVAALWIETDRGRYRVRGNDIRYVLRSAGGELLNSTYFSPEMVSSPDGRLSRLTIRGLGYGHGVGMCQWGAIGRARAGQDFRTILRTYYPGTTVARAY